MQAAANIARNLYDVASDIAIDYARDQYENLFPNLVSDFALDAAEAAVPIAASAAQALAHRAVNMATNTLPYSENPLEAKLQRIVDLAGGIRESVARGVGHALGHRFPDDPDVQQEARAAGRGPRRRQGAKVKKGSGPASNSGRAGRNYALYKAAAYAPYVRPSRPIRPYSDKYLKTMQIANWFYHKTWDANDFPLGTQLGVAGTAPLYKERKIWLAN